MPMEGWVKFLVHKTPLEFYRKKGVAVIFQTIVVNDDKDSKFKKNYVLKP